MGRGCYLNDSDVIPHDVINVPGRDLGIGRGLAGWAIRCYELPDDKVTRDCIVDLAAKDKFTWIVQLPNIQQETESNKLEEGE